MKSMKYIVSLLFLLSVGFSKDFSVIIEKPFNNALFDITQNYDRSITAVGLSEHYEQKNNTAKSYSNPFDYLSSLSNVHSKQMQILTIDKKANIRTDKTLNLKNFSEAHSVVKTKENGYFVGGHTNDGKISLVKLGTNANTIFTKSLGTQNNNTLNKLVALRDGGVLLIGSSTTSRSQSDSLFQRGLGLSDIYVIRVSGDGQELWSKKYGTQYDDKGIDATEAKDGSIILVGTTQREGTKDITLMRISEHGNKIWIKHHAEANKLTAHRIIRLRDGNFLLSLSKMNELGKEQINLIKFDLHKNILLDKEIYTSYTSALKDIKEFSNGGIVGVGYVQDEYNTDALVMLLDSQLNMTVQEHFGTENYDIFNAVSILHNSQIAAAGINTHNDSQEANMWIVKLNRDATLAQVSTKVENHILHLKKIFKDELYKKELTIKEDLSIELSGEKLLFGVGQSQLSEHQKKFLDKFCTKIIPFLKQNKEFISNLEVNGHTSSEWAKSDFTQNYLNNEKLSMNRAYAVLSHIFKSQDAKTQEWLSKVLKGTGIGFAKKVIYDNIEYKNQSRRVSIKILLKDS